MFMHGASVTHLIVGDSLWLRDKLSAAHPAVAVSEEPSIHLCRLHLNKNVSSVNVMQFTISNNHSFGAFVLDDNGEFVLIICITF